MIKKILIVDDALFMRNVLKDILPSEGYDVAEAENGKEAIKQIEKIKPDLVFLDIIMPEMDGIEVLQKVGKKVKVCVISSVGQEKMVAAAIQLGAIDYILKPISTEQDKEKILRIINEL